MACLLKRPSTIAVFFFFFVETTASNRYCKWNPLSPSSHSNCNGWEFHLFSHPSLSFSSASSFPTETGLSTEWPTLWRVRLSTDHPPQDHACWDQNWVTALTISQSLKDFYLHRIFCGAQSSQTVILMPLRGSMILGSFWEFPIGLVTVQAFTGTYGINYGRVADNIPGPENVVTLLKASKLKNVRIYDADHSVLEAFKGSGLELVIGVPNQLLKDMNASEDRAMSWVRENIKSFMPHTNIRGIAVGNEILGVEDQEIQEVLVGAIKNVYKAIDRLGLKDVVEVSTPHSQAVFANSYPPSSCTFNDNVIQYMKPLLEFLSKIGAAFYINIYPFLAYRDNPENIDLNYALFQSNPGIYDAKTKLHYDNMFDAEIDAAYAALEAAGFGKMEVRVSETGWASKGDDDETGASVHNARTYNYNLRKRLALRKGTPFRPKIAVKAYVFALFNEDLKPGKASERNFGLFKANGSIAYDIGFTGLKSSAASMSLLSLKDIQAQGLLGPYFMALTMCIPMMLLVLIP